MGEITEAERQELVLIERYRPNPEQDASDYEAASAKIFARQRLYAILDVESSIAVLLIVALIFRKIAISVERPTVKPLTTDHN